MKEIRINVGSQVEEIKQLSAKLHPEKDLDIIQEIRKVSKRDRSKFYRDALRHYIKTQKIIKDFGMK